MKEGFREEIQYGYIRQLNSVGGGGGLVTAKSSGSWDSKNRVTWKMEEAVCYLVQVNTIITNSSTD